jgi:Cys-rich protein (TIGR01571 family)
MQLQPVILQPIYIQPYTMQQIPQQIQPQFAPPTYQFNPNPTPSLETPKYNFPTPWSSGLCSCCEDFGICFQGAFCPCCLYGKNSEQIGEGSCIGNCLCYLFCFPCCQQTKTRNLIRKKYNLIDEPCGDCCVSWFCSTCALCQEAREIKYKTYLEKPNQQTMK